MADGIYVDSEKVYAVASELADSYSDPAELIKAAKSGAKLKIWPDGGHCWIAFGDLNLGHVPVEFVRMDKAPNEA